MEPKKRSRSANYTPGEKEALLNLVYEHRGIVENKKTDAVSVEQKKTAWQTIAQQFNAEAPSLYFRPVESLKKFYEKMKEDIRKKESNFKRDLYRTGGGPPPEHERNNIDNLLLSVVNEKTVYGLENPYDSDMLQGNLERQYDHNVDIPNEIVHEEEQVKKRRKEEAATQIEILHEPENSQTKVKETPQKIDEKKGKPFHPNIKANLKRVYTPKNQSRRRPTVIRTLTSSKLGEKYNTLIDKKLELVECLKKEHELRMESLKLDVMLKKNQLSQMDSHTIDLFEDTV